MSDHELKCPRPIRPLKRKASQLELFDPLTLQQASQRHNISIVPPTFVSKWLANIPDCSYRQLSRSDSFLSYNINRGHHNQAGPMSRPGSAQSTPRNHQYQPVSPESLSTRSTLNLLAHVQPTSSLAICSTLVSRPSRDQSSLCPSTQRAEKRVEKPYYRDELRNHGVILDRSGGSIPESVREYAQSLLEAQRSSPGLKDEELSSALRTVVGLENADEETTSRELNTTSLFPRAANYDWKIAVGGSVPLDRTALPHAFGRNFLPIVQPKPDYQYGYPHASFNADEAEVMEHRRLRDYARPSSAAFWPFFFIELKSVSHGGTHWVAENQNAGSGAHCVNSMKTLMNYTKDNEKRTNILNSLAFSCIADVYSASLWVHWHEAGDSSRFISSKVKSYQMDNKEDFQSLRSGIRNIIDYGIDKRLPAIKQALRDVLSQVPQWDHEDQAARKRKTQFAPFDDATVEEAAP